MARDRGQPISHNMLIPNEQISFDIDAFDEALRSQGVKFAHYQAIRCPIGMTDIRDSRNPHHDHSNCSGGFIYREAGTITAFFSGNSMSQSQQEQGLMDGSTVQVTLPRFYDSDAEKRLIVQPFDRFFIKDLQAFVGTHQLVEAHQTGLDRLQYPAVKVDYIVDNRGVEYHEGHDFEITSEGAIKWISSNRPGYNVELGRGDIYSIRYEYVPFWYVTRLLHEVRVTQAEDYVSGERKLQRMPYAVLLTREIVFDNENRPTDGSPGDLRDIPSPRSGGFGPR